MPQTAGRDAGALRPWLRSVAAGLAGTTVMTATMRLEHHLRAPGSGPVDYDATGHVVTAAANVLHYRPRTAAGRHALFLLVHWGYGSAVGVEYRLARRVLGSRAAAVAAFYAACQGMAFTLFPTFGETPPPWRWRRDMLMSSLVQHAVYAVAVGAATSALDARAEENMLASRRADSAGLHCGAWLTPPPSSTR